MTTIGPDTRINGRIEGDADVMVEGRVDGTISLSETLTVAPGGYVSGDIEAQIVVIEGFASGTIRASAVVHLMPTAQVEGEIYASAVRLDPGSRLRGRVEMDVDAAPPLPKRPERAARPARQPAAKPAVEPKTTIVAAIEPEPAAEPPPPPKPKPAPRAAPKSAAKPAAKPAQKASSGNGELDVDPDELTVKQLRELLTERGLPLSGTKTELVHRLRTGE